MVETLRLSYQREPKTFPRLPTGRTRYLHDRCESQGGLLPFSSSPEGGGR